jgi:ribonuclease T2
MAKSHPIALLIVLLVATAAQAQQPGRPGDFDYYLLTLSWSPQFCAGHSNEPATRRQCGATPHYGFVVHGLWPQNLGRPWPAFCQPAPPVPQRLIDQTLPLTPDAALIQHEWAKHGTCTGLSVDDYFTAVAQAAHRVHIPERLVAPAQPVVVSLAEIKQMFVETNPSLTANMMSVTCSADRQTVAEIRICLDRQLAYRTCGPDVVDSCRPDKDRLQPVPQ